MEYCQNRRELCFSLKWFELSKVQMYINVTLFLKILSVIKMKLPVPTDFLERSRDLPSVY